MTTLLVLALTLPMIFLFLNHPLSFGVTLLIQTLIISMITGIMNCNFWFSYMLFLVMVGGMLVLFIYMTSIAANEKFMFSSPLFFLLMMSMIIALLLTLADQFIFSHILSTAETSSQPFSPENSLSVSKYTTWPTHYFLYLMFIYLLITLIMVVKVTKIEQGPIRQKF